MHRSKVCVVGGGAAGLCAARHLAANTSFDFAVFEQTSAVGGTWVYQEGTGNDTNGLPIHSSMYRDLRTNLPARIMNFPDFTRMTAEQPCCVTHEEVLDYLKNYAEHFDLRRHIQFDTRVENVRLNTTSGTKDSWMVTVRNLKTGQQDELQFDAIMICNGHYFDPHEPAIQGVDTFPGTIMHSHSYRKPEVFAGKTVVILGAAASGIDIGIDVARHASHVYLSHNNERLISALPSNMSQVMGVDHVEGDEIFLRDETSVRADVFLFCTGYHFSFPFLDDSCEIRVEDNHVTPLYKHLINIEHPSMCIVGLPTIVVPFPMFHVQVQYFLALLRNVAELPPKPEMLEDSRLKTVRKRHAHKLMSKQWEYNDSLAIAGRFDRLPALYRIGYEAWSVRRKVNLLLYKYSKFVVSEDGTSVKLEDPKK